MSERTGEVKLLDFNAKAHMPIKFVGSSSFIQRRPSLNKIPLRNNREREIFRFSLDLSKTITQKTEETLIEDQNSSTQRALPSIGARLNTKRSSIESVEGTFTTQKELPERSKRSQSVPKLSLLANETRTDSFKRTTTLRTTTDALNVTKIKCSSSSSVQEKFKFNIQQRTSSSKFQDWKQKGSQSQRTLSANIKKGFINTSRSKFSDISKLHSARKSEEKPDLSLSTEKERYLARLIHETKDCVNEEENKIITQVVDKQFNELDVLHEKYLKRNNNMKWAIATLGKPPKTSFIRFFTSTKAGFLFCQQRILTADLEL